MLTILGAGLTGLSIAFMLCKKGMRPTIMEQENSVGGLARTFRYGDFAFDIGPHVLRTNDQNLLSFVTALTDFVTIQSDPKIWKAGILHDTMLPVISMRNLSLLPEEKRRKVKEQLSNVKISTERPGEDESFEEFLKKKIGQTLYEEYFKTYSEKWWGCPAKQLSAKLAPRNFTIQGDQFYGHISTSYRKYERELYPSKAGIACIAQELETKVKNMGAKIMTGNKVKNLLTDGDRISSIVVENNGSEIEYKTDEIFSTIPLTDLAGMLGIYCDLSYRSDVCVFLEVNKTSLFRNKWLYFHDEKIIFSRISEPKLFNKLNSPYSKTSLCVEIACQEEDNVWKNADLCEAVIQQLHDLGIVRRKDVSVLGLQKIPHAYPIYKLGFERKHKQVKEALSQLKNLNVVGRTGSFIYENMDAALKRAVVTGS